MKDQLKHFLLFAVLTICCTATAVAQATLKGMVVDAGTNEPLIGATVAVKGSTLGAITDVNGGFTLKVPNSGVTIVFTYIGYKEKQMDITGQGTIDLGSVALEHDAQMLQDVVVTSSIAIARKTPVAVSSVSMDFIEEKLGTQEFPEILKSTPGVHANKEGGGYGDSGRCLLVELGRIDRCDPHHANPAWFGCFKSIGSFCRWYHQHYNP